jgi:hypothetical protein
MGKGAPLFQFSRGSIQTQDKIYIPSDDVNTERAAGGNRPSSQGIEFKSVF